MKIIEQIKDDVAIEKGRDTVMDLINRVIKGDKLIIRPVKQGDSEDVIEEINWIEDVYKSLLPHDRERIKEFVGRFRMAKVG